MKKYRVMTSEVVFREYLIDATDAKEAGEQVRLGYGKAQEIIDGEGFEVLDAEEVTE